MSWCRLIVAAWVACSTAGLTPTPAQVQAGAAGAAAERLRQREHALHVDDFRKAGVTLRRAAAGEVDVVIELPAEVRLNGDRLSHLSAPFPGIVRSVHKSTGDAVRTGETLAVIESETLATYPLKAAFDGVVIDKHVAPGDTVTRDSRLFVIGDLSTVWVEIAVHSHALPLVSVGDKVRVEMPHGAVAADGAVSYVSPVIDPATRTATARVVLANAGGSWRPGMFATALVSRPEPAAVVVSRRALHQVQGRTVVFAVEGEKFAIRPVVVGAVGRFNAAIERGLIAGETYADERSFLVKAELLKGEEEQEH